jgi:hypothetical protein
LIDKADIRVPEGVRFTPEFLSMNELFSRDGHPWRNPSQMGRWKPDPAYAGRASFDDCGLDVVVHADCKMTRKRTHKIEILRAGEKTYDEMVHLVQKVVVCEPEDMGLMRVDLTADVSGVPVDWFKRHVYVKHKQARRELGEVEAYQLVTKGRADTLYGGVKPNQVRIYDKTGERRMQQQKYLRRFTRLNAELPPSSRVEPTSFETKYGHGMWDVITRVERQVHGRHLESLSLKKITDLLTATELDPFNKLVFFTQQTDMEREFLNLSWRDQMAAEALLHRVQTQGISATLSHMKAALGTNFYREKEKFASFLRLADNVVGIDSQRLRDAYASSTYRQMLRAA